MSSNRPRLFQILLVEDNRFDVELIRHEFDRSGIAAEIRAVETKPALRQALGPELDLVIADHTLPAFEGFEVFDLLEECGLSVPVIVMSGLHREDLSARAEESGAAAYLSKDRLSEIGEVVKEVLRRYGDR